MLNGRARKSFNIQRSTFNIPVERAGVTNQIAQFLNYLTFERNVSPNTVAAYRDDLESFVGFLAEDYFTTPLGELDRAWLELLYASGLRIGELVGINIADIQLRARLVKVRGKGSKERIVPFGSKAEEALRAWTSVRAAAPEQPALFTNYRGARITARSVRRLFDRYVRGAALRAGVSPHTLRH